MLKWTANRLSASHSHLFTTSAEEIKNRCIVLTRSFPCTLDHILNATCACRYWYASLVSWAKPGSKTVSWLVIGVVVRWTYMLNIDKINQGLEVSRKWTLAKDFGGLSTAGTNARLLELCSDLRQLKQWGVAIRDAYDRFRQRHYLSNKAFRCLTLQPRLWN